MARPKEYSVIIDESVLIWLIDRFKRKYPHESVAFLFGQYWEDSKFDIPYITLGREPHFTSDSESGDFEHSEVIRQTKLAASEGSMLLGWSHSHPYEDPHLEMTSQTITDARTQIKYRFSISIIVALWGTEGCWIECWKEGFAASLDLLISTETRLVPFKTWYHKKFKKRPWLLK